MECDEMRAKFPHIQFESCCISCHEDVDEGYGDDLWFFAEDGKLHFVCCAIGRGLED